MTGLAERLKNSRKQNHNPEERQKEKELIESFSAPNKPLGLSDRNRLVAKKSIITGPPNNRITEYPDNRITESSNRITEQITESSIRITEYPDNRITESPNNRADNRITESPDNRADSRITEYPDNRITESPDIQNTYKQFNLPPIDYTKKPSDLNKAQYELLHALYFNRPYKVDSEKKDGIGDLLYPPVSVDNVRSRTLSLIKKGYILQRFSINSSPNKMTTCIVDTDRCFPLFGYTPVSNDDQKKLKPNLFFNRITESPNNRADNRITESPGNRADNRITESPNHRIDPSIIVSSKFLKETNLLSDALQKNPDLAYWNDKLKIQKIESWMAELKISDEDMLESLCHCAFDMIEKGERDKKGQPIKNVLDWLYAILKKHRYYDKPAGYKSFEEKALERAEKRLREKQERAKQLNEIKKAERDADIDLKFAEMMQDREGEAFKKCHSSLPVAAKARRTGLMFENAMRAIFVELFYKESETL